MSEPCQDIVVDETRLEKVKQMYLGDQKIAEEVFQAFSETPSEYADEICFSCSDENFPILDNLLADAISFRDDIDYTVILLTSACKVGNLNLIRHLASKMSAVPESKPELPKPSRYPGRQTPLGFITPVSK